MSTPPGLFDAKVSLFFSFKQLYNYKQQLIIIIRKQLLVRLEEAHAVKVLDCDIVVSEFKLRSSYYVHFWTYTLGKGMNPLISLAMGYYYH